MTLIELLVVVGIMGVLAALAAPSLNEFIMNKRVDGIANELMGDFRLARSTTAQMDKDVYIAFRRTSTLTCYTVYTNGQYGDCDCSLGAGAACTGSEGSPLITELKTLYLPLSSGIQLTSSANLVRLVALTQLSQLDNFSVDVAPATTGGSGGQMRLQMNRTGRTHLCAVQGHGGYGPCS